MVVGGDWNCPIQEFLGTNVCQALKLRVIGTGLPTCGDNELDYLCVSECVEGKISLELSEDVPFRPHCALKLKLHIDPFNLSTPQLPRFTSELREEPEPYHQVEACLTFLFDEPTRSNEITNRFAGLSKSVELCLCRHQLGIGCSLRVLFQHCVPRNSTRGWDGSRSSYWQRWQHHLSKTTPESSEEAKGRLQGLLDELPKFWAGEASEASAFGREATKVLESGDYPAIPLQLAHSQLLEATKEAVTKSRLSYWLQGGLQKGMGPLFKALKKGEATILRPFRNLSPEARAFARAKQRVASWQGRFRVCPHLRLKLGTHTNSFLKEKFSRCKDKAPGPDGWTFAMLRKLNEPMLQDISSLYSAMEHGLQVPLQFTLTQVSMLLKSETRRKLKDRFP